MKKGSNGEPRKIISGFTEKEVMPVWVPNMVIRHRETGEELLVIHVYRQCTFVVDLHSSDLLVTPKAILQRDYYRYAPDGDMNNKDRIQYEKEWFYDPVKIT